MDETTAISRIKQGNLTGLEELVNLYQVKAVYCAFLILHERDLAEEVAQNAFVKVAQKINLYDDSRPFAPWFFRIVINDAVKLSRHNARMERLAEDTDEEMTALANWLIDPHPLPEQQIEISENAELLRRALDALHPQQRAVVVMRYYLQMSESEISESLHKPLSTVKWWMRAARKRLRLMVRAEDVE
jgi:RNA polymerase sigma-70 factor (ECF subfamily)